MLRPSYTDLKDILNKNNEHAITSRYTIAIAVSKRARQLIDHSEPLVGKVITDKPVSIAVQELNEGHIKILQEIL